MTTIEVAVREHQDGLIGVAYRMPGTVADAQDAVQEAFLRLERTGSAGIDNVGGWLNRTTSRSCLDRLTTAQARREVYVGPWLAEPLAADGDRTDPVELAESVSMAYLVVLESPSPAERVAFVLHDVFGYVHAEVAVVLLRSEPACRQLVSRARSHIEGRRPQIYTTDGHREQRCAVAQEPSWPSPERRAVPRLGKSLMRTRTEPRGFPRDQR